MDKTSLAVVLVPVALAALWVSSCATPSPSPELSLSQEALYATLRADLVALARGEELYYTEHYTYSADPGKLGFGPSEGVVVVIDATEDGWSARATHPGLGEGRGCAFYYGRISPPSSPVTPSSPGEVFCTE